MCRYSWNSWSAGMRPPHFPLTSLSHSHSETSLSLCILAFFYHKCNKIKLHKKYFGLSLFIKDINRLLTLQINILYRVVIEKKLCWFPSITQIKQKCVYFHMIGHFFAKWSFSIFTRSGKNCLQCAAPLANPFPICHYFDFYDCLCFADFITMFSMPASCSLVIDNVGDLLSSEQSGD